MNCGCLTRYAYRDKKVVGKIFCACVFRTFPIISTINHPDLDAKRAIESNVQRKVTIFKPNEIKSLQDYNVDFIPTNN
jgi:hypothetical protein